MLRRTFLTIAGAAAGSRLVPPLLASPVHPSSNSRRMEIAHGWFICADPSNSGRDEHWYLVPHAQAVPTRVPSILQESYPGYHGVVWYWNSFRAPEKHFQDGQALLLFHAVDYYAEVWLNGKRLGEHEGGETPFLLDATANIRFGEANVLALRVLNPPTAGVDGFLLKETPHGNKVQPYATGNRYDYGGIVEPVELLLTPSARIADLHLLPDWRTGVVRVRSEISNKRSSPSGGTLTFVASGSSPVQAEQIVTAPIRVPSGASAHGHEISIENPRLWDIDDPNCYSLTVSLTLDGERDSDIALSQFGFRDFRVTDGFFHLNGRRVFVKSTHTGNHAPFSQIVPPPGSPDMLRMDLIYAKAAGFNMVRFISGVAHPYQLELCNELGLMVYEESLASWLLADSPQMVRRFRSSLREMVLRDRNHPCVVLWGVLNETADGPVFREAVASLPLLRSLDTERLVLLSSGRFDGHLEVGSVCNPGESEWQHVWGTEAPGAANTTMKYPSGEGTGDFHFYPTVPQSKAADQLLRTLGQQEKPVFLSEYGIGSMMHVIHECRMYEQAGIRSDAEDYVLMRSMADRFTEDWRRFGMDDAYPFPEVLLEESQREMAVHRRRGFDLIRSNPQLAGFSLTGMLDHGMTGEGLWRFWRDWKPAIFDAVRDGWAPVRWCLFAEPTHIYAGSTVAIEAVLANEGLVREGEYPVEFRIKGPSETVWQRSTSIQIPEQPVFAVPVLQEQARIKGAPGVYQLIPSVAHGIAPPYRSQQIYVSDPASLPRLDGVRITTWGLPQDIEQWLSGRGAQMSDFKTPASSQRECIVVGNPGASASLQDWIELANRIAQGGVALFLSPAAFTRNGDAAGLLPLRKKGRIYEFHDWLYHKECVAKPHPIFDGLEAAGLLRWSYYGPTLPRFLFDGLEVDPSYVSAAAFATGYNAPGGYASGILLATFPFGAGSFLLNSFEILENKAHPVAAHMLVNAIRHGQAQIHAAKVPLPGDFSSLLSQIGYEN